MDTAQIDLFTNYASEVLALISNDWKFKFVSNTASHVISYSPEELVGKSFFEKIHKDDLDTVLKQTESVKSRNNVFVLNYRLTTKNGNNIWIENTLRKVNDEYISVMRDISSKKSAEDLLKRFMEAVDSSPDCIVMANLNKVIMYANPAVEELTGYKTAEIIGKNANFLWTGLMDDEFSNRLWTTVKDNKTRFYGEINNIRKNQIPYIADLRVIPILDNQHEVNFFVGTLRDITRAKEIDRMKTEFISLASHQLRTPLTAIKWRLEMMISGEEGDITESQKNYLREIDHSNERMIELVNGLLNISRIESGRLIIDPKPTSLETLMLSALDEVEVKIKEKKLKVHLSFQTNIIDINVDPKLIRNAFLNLLTNAVKYTPAEGEIFVSIYIDGNDAIIKVKDTGYGIPKSDQGRVFEKFFRADNIQKIETEGTGLGLYLIKAIVDASGGKIWFESDENKGTTFWIALSTKGVSAKKGEVSLT